MTIWAIGDLHLSFGVPNKKMDVFGEDWKDHDKKIEEKWRERIQPDDLVLLPGDISWAKRMDEAMADLEWIDKLPGTKVMIRGNHDYWWPSLSKLQTTLPSSIHAIHNTTFLWKGYEVAGARLWDSDYTFGEFINYKENPRANLTERVDNSEENRRIFEREIERLKLSLKEFKDPAAIRLVMTHYPPLDAKLNPSPVTELLEKYHVKACVFGHLHNVRKESLPFGEKGGVRYILTSADYVDFTPVKVI